MRRIGAGLSNMLSKALQGRGLSAIALSAFLLLGLYLFRYALPTKPFSEELLIYDTIWLDAWSLGFVLVCAAIWLCPMSGRSKAWLGLAALGIYGFVEIAVIFDGTPFSSYAYWGDQKFRQAMVLKFMELGYPVDFYYKGLAPFYPPTLYLAFAGVGKVLALPAYAMLKTGGMLVFLLGPFLLHWLWKPLVGHFRSWLIVLFTFLVCASPYPYMLSAPHAFLAIAIFIPWWLRFVDNVHGMKSQTRHWIVGGLLGALIMTVYFYPLILGAFLLILKMAYDLRCRWIGKRTGLCWSRAVGVMTATLLFSIWYWGPAVLSVMEFGADRSRGGWHHIDSTSINLAFMSFTWVGVLFLGGIVLALRRWRVRLHRHLLILLGSVIPFLFVGSLLGATDHEINLVKARDMVLVFAGPFIGLAIGLLLRRRRSVPARWTVPVVAALAIMVLCYQFNDYAKSDLVKTARKTVVPTWGTDSTEMANRAGSVFLCGHETFPSFYPVYTFIAGNEHYSHPASRFKQRYDFLDLLENGADPRIVNIALRTNRYDAVDFFMPHRDGAVFDITVSLSNYPDRYFTRLFKFPESMVADTLLYSRCKGDDLYKVLAPPDRSSPLLSYVRPSAPDTLVQLMHLQMIRERLTDAGRVELDAYTGINWSNWQSLSGPGKTAVFGDSVQVKDISVVADGDSLHLLMAFEALETLSRRFRISVHLFVGEQMSNYDFDPVNPTDSWGRYETVICRRTIPKPDRPVKLFVSIFDNLGSLTGVYKGEIDVGR
jgi:hypothetical protein